jgi:hypothetical protein
MNSMSQWKIKPSSLILLLSVICIMLLIVVLPDVDLLDTAFHNGTAPIMVHARANSAPLAITVWAGVALLWAAAAIRFTRGQQPLAVVSPPNFLPILLRSLRR